MENSDIATGDVSMTSGVISEMMSSMRFASAGRMLADRARDLGISAPTFRSPPRLAGARRSVTRHGDRSVTVAVVVRDRPPAAVVADMIDGVVLASGADDVAARRLHDHLWVAAHEWLASATGASPPLRAVA